MTPDASVTAPTTAIRAGRVRRDADSKIAGELVDAHCKTASLRTDEIDLHDHGHRPAEALIDPEQHVGEDDPAPCRGEHQEKGHRNRDLGGPRR
jgi:hypothetical protein